MSWIPIVIAAAAAMLLLWTLLAPRSQWRVLSAWSLADPHRGEPGAGAYGVRRFVASLGLIGISVVALVPIAVEAATPQRATPPTLIEQMWGTPQPALINRVVRSVDEPPDGLVEGQIEGVQGFDPQEDHPAYLISLIDYRRLGSSEIAGLIGVDPDEGTSAMSSADMVIKIRGPVLCIPRAAVVRETTTSVEIGIFYGLPDSADGKAVDSLAGCAVDSTVTAAALLPIPLTAPVGDRTVQLLDGTPIDVVPLLELED